MISKGVNELIKHAGSLGEAAKTLELGLTKAAEKTPIEKLAKDLSGDAKTYTENAEIFGSGLLEETKEREAGFEKEFEKVENKLAEQDGALEKATESFESSVAEVFEGPEEEDLVDWLLEPLNEPKIETIFERYEEEFGPAFEEFTAEEFEAVFEEPTAGEREQAEEIINTIFEDGRADIPEEDREVFKLLLRVGIKVSAKAAVIVARNIAKDKETNKGTRIMLNSFADTVEQGSSFADKAIAGDSNADLQKDVISHIGKR